MRKFFFEFIFIQFYKNLKVYFRTKPISEFEVETLFRGSVVLTQQFSRIKIFSKLIYLRNLFFSVKLMGGTPKVSKLKSKILNTFKIFFVQIKKTDMFWEYERELIDFTDNFKHTLSCKTFFINHRKIKKASQKIVRFTLSTKRILSDYLKLINASTTAKYNKKNFFYFFFKKKIKKIDQTKLVFFNLKKNYFKKFESLIFYYLNKDLRCLLSNKRITLKIRSAVKRFFFFSQTKFLKQKKDEKFFKSIKHYKKNYLRLPKRLKLSSKSKKIFFNILKNKRLKKIFLIKKKKNLNLKVNKILKTKNFLFYENYISFLRSNLFSFYLLKFKNLCKKAKKFDKSEKFVFLNKKKLVTIFKKIFLNVLRLNVDKNNLFLTTLYLKNNLLLKKQKLRLTVKRAVADGIKRPLKTYTEASFSKLHFFFDSYTSTFFTPIQIKHTN